MRLALTQKHLHFFKEKKLIELEGVFSEEEAAFLSDAIDDALQKRAKKLITTRPPLELYRSGRDLSKSSPLIEKKSKIYALAALAAELTASKAVRLAFDQAIRTGIETGPLFPEASSLHAISCLRPLLCGVFLRLKNDPHPPEFLPQKVGSALFFSPDLPLPWGSLVQTPEQSFFLLAYAGEKCLYVLEKNDPHTHELKKEGYVFGDTLKTPLLSK